MDRTHLLESLRGLDPDRFSLSNIKEIQVNRKEFLELQANMPFFSDVSRSPTSVFMGIPVVINDSIDDGKYRIVKKRDDLKEFACRPFQFVLNPE